MYLVCFALAGLSPALLLLGFGYFIATMVPGFHRGWSRLNRDAPTLDDGRETDHSDSGEPVR